MNEASNFCDGICNQLQNVDSSELSKLRYIPGNRFMFAHGISVDAYHSNGAKQLDTHSLFGLG